VMWLVSGMDLKYVYIPTTILWKLARFRVGSQEEANCFGSFLGD